MIKKIIFSVSLFTVFSFFIVYGSEIKGDGVFDAECIIKSICKKIDSYYPHKETASRIIRGLNSNLSSGKYAGIDSPAVFASMVTTDMENLSRDKHLDLLFDPGLVSEMRAQKEKGIERTYTASQVETYRLNNFGFTTLKILEGNVGYLELELFFDARYAGDTAVAAMAFFSNCDALIIDLRNNGGGWGSMVGLLLSYFIDQEGELVMKITRSTVDNSYYAAMTLPYVPGKKLTAIPVYLLTSGSTASAAEAFALRMRLHNQRVRLVGNTTAGAENPVDHQILDDSFILQIPSDQVIFQEKNGGWERVGIKPDISVNVPQALETAYVDVLKKLKISTKNRKKQDRYQWAIEGLEARQAPLTLKKSIMRSYVGRYGDSSIMAENGDLFYIYKKRTKRKLIPISANYFLVEGVDHYRIRFRTTTEMSLILNVVFNDGYIVTRVKSH